MMSAPTETTVPTTPVAEPGSTSAGLTTVIAVPGSTTSSQSKPQLEPLPAQWDEKAGRVAVVLVIDCLDWVAAPLATQNTLTLLLHAVRDLPVEVTFRLSGNFARALRRENAETLLAELRRHDLGMYATRHWEHPTVAEYVGNRDWQTGVQEFLERETIGYEEVAWTAGRVPSCYGSGLWVPAALAGMLEWDIRAVVEPLGFFQYREQPFYLGGRLHLSELGRNWLDLGTWLREHLPTDSVAPSEAELDISANGSITFSLTTPPMVLDLADQFCRQVESRLVALLQPDRPAAEASLVFAPSANPSRLRGVLVVSLELSTLSWEKPLHDWFVGGANPDIGVLEPTSLPTSWTQTAVAVIRELVRRFSQHAVVQPMSVRQVTERLENVPYDFGISIAHIIELARQIDGKIRPIVTPVGYLAPADQLALLTATWLQQVKSTKPPAKQSFRSPLGPAHSSNTAATVTQINGTELVPLLEQLHRTINQTGQLPSPWSVQQGEIALEDLLATLAAGIAANASDLDLTATKFLQPVFVVRDLPLRTGVWAADDPVTDAPETGCWTWSILPPGFTADEQWHLAQLQRWSFKPVVDLEET